MAFDGELRVEALSRGEGGGQLAVVSTDEAGMSVGGEERVNALLFLR